MLGAAAYGHFVLVEPESWIRASALQYLMPDLPAPDTPALQMSVFQ